MECQEPPKTPNNPVYPNFRLSDKDELPIVVRRKEFAWMLGRSLSSLSQQETEEPEELCNATQFLFGLHIIPLYMTLWIPQEVQHHLSLRPRHMNGVRY